MKRDLNFIEGVEKKDKDDIIMTSLYLEQRDARGGGDEVTIGNGVDAGWIGTEELLGISLGRKKKDLE